MAVAPEELFELKRFIEKQLGITLQPWQLAVLEQTLYNPEVTHQAVAVFRHKSVYEAVDSLPSTHRITLEWPIKAELPTEEEETE